MNNYLITYNGGKTVTVTDIDAPHAKATLKRVIPNILSIDACIKIKKDLVIKKNKKIIIKNI